MEIDGKKIIGLPTFTRSGQRIGKVKSVELDLLTDKVLYILSRFCFLLASHSICESRFLLGRKSVAPSQGA